MPLAPRHLLNTVEGVDRGVRHPAAHGCFDDLDGGPVGGTADFAGIVGGSLGCGQCFLIPGHAVAEDRIGPPLSIGDTPHGPGKAVISLADPDRFSRLVCTVGGHLLMARSPRPTRGIYSPMRRRCKKVSPGKRITMALNDEDISTTGAGGEGTADGGSNPEGHDGGADGTAGEGPADGGSNPEGHDGGADGTAGEGPADGGSNPEGHDGGADGNSLTKSRC